MACMAKINTGPSATNARVDSAGRTVFTNAHQQIESTNVEMACTTTSRDTRVKRQSKRLTIFHQTNDGPRCNGADDDSGEVMRGSAKVCGAAANSRNLLSIGRPLASLIPPRTARTESAWGSPTLPRATGLASGTLGGRHVASGAATGPSCAPRVLLGMKWGFDSHNRAVEGNHGNLKSASMVGQKRAVVDSRGRLLVNRPLAGV